MRNHPLDKPGPCKDYCHDLCDDGNMCAINYKISNEECTCLAEPESLNCDDGDPETDDNCVPSVGCVHLPKTPKTIPVCSGEDAVPCGDDGGYFVCIFGGAHNIFNEDHRTVCSDSSSLTSHIENEKDYCGQCSVTNTPTQSQSPTSPWIVTPNPTTKPTVRPTTTSKPTDQCLNINTYNEIDNDIETLKNNIGSGRERSHFLGGIVVSRGFLCCLLLFILMT